MNHGNPLGWARMPVDKGNFTREPSSNEKVCTTLSEIFVDQMGIAKGITLDIDPKTGLRSFHFVINADSPIRKTLVHDEILGIPVRYTLAD